MRRSIPVEIPLVAGGWLDGSVQGYWKLDGNPRDASGQGRHGVVGGVVANRQDRRGAGDRALGLEGAGWVTVDSGPDLSGFDAMTACAWVWSAEDVRSEATVLSLHEGHEEDPSLYAYRLWVDAAGRPVASIHPDGGDVAHARGSDPLAATRWAHLCFTYDGAELTLLVNGGVVASGPATGAVRSRDSQMVMGSCDGPVVCQGAVWPGRIDEAVILSRALTPREVTHYWRSRADFGAVLTGPLWPSTAAPVHLNEAQDDWDDLRVTEEGVEIEHGVIGARPLATLEGDLDEHVVAYWPLDRGALRRRAPDEAVATAQGGAEHDTGRFGDAGGALVFSGEDQWVDTGFAYEPGPAQDFTYEAWFRATPGRAAVQSILGWANGNEHNLVISCGNDGTLSGIVATGGAPAMRTMGEGVCDDGLWHHAALVRYAEAEEVRFYLDGAERARAPLARGQPDAGGTHLFIGARQLRHPPNGEIRAELHFAGAVDEVVIHSTARSPQWLRDRADPLPRVRLHARTGPLLHPEGKPLWRAYRLWYGDNRLPASDLAVEDGVFSPRNDYLGWWSFDGMAVASRGPSVTGAGIDGQRGGVDVSPATPLVPGVDGFTLELLGRHGGQSGEVLSMPYDGLDLAVDWAPAGVTCRLPTAALEDVLPAREVIDGWRSFLCTLTAERFATYLDGVVDVDVRAFGGGFDEPTGPLHIGGPLPVDEVRVMSRALGPEERLPTGPLIFTVTREVEPPCVDVDGDGVRVCDGDCDDRQTARTPGKVEECDGLDNDCDGAVDEDLVGDPADRILGVCALQTKVCAGQAGWIEPDYEAIDGFERAEESCDELDNDCDGHLNQIRPPGENRAGVCYFGLQECRQADRRWVEPDYSLLLDHQDPEIRCDGLDNDCDGVADGLDECVPFAQRRPYRTGFDLTLRTDPRVPASSRDNRVAAPVQLPLVAGGWADADTETWPLDGDAADRMDRPGEATAIAGRAHVVPGGGDVAGLDRMSVCIRVRPADSAPEPSGWVLAGVGDFTDRVAANDAWQLSLLPGGIPRFSLGAAGGVASVDAQVAIPSEAWTHLCGVYGLTWVRLYVNGALVAFRQHSLGVHDTGRDMHIGGCEGVGCAARIFEGLVDDLAVVGRRLTAEEVRMAWGAGQDWGTPLTPGAQRDLDDVGVSEFGLEVTSQVYGARPLSDDPGAAGPGVNMYWPLDGSVRELSGGIPDLLGSMYGGRPALGRFGDPRGAIRLDGVGGIDTAWIFAPSAQTAFTVELWARLAPSGLDEVTLWGWEVDGLRGLRLSCRGAVLGLVARAGGQGDRFDVAGPLGCEDGVWHHYGLVHNPDDGALTVFVDGRPVVNETIPGADFDPDGRSMFVGAHQGRNGPEMTVVGEVDEFVVHAAARSEPYMRDRSSPVPLVRFLASASVPDGPVARYDRYHLWWGDPEATSPDPFRQDNVLATPVALAAWWRFEDADTTWFDDSSGRVTHAHRSVAIGLAPPPERGAAIRLSGGGGLLRFQGDSLRTPTWTLEAWARRVAPRPGTTASVIDDLDGQSRRRLLAMSHEGRWLCQAQSGGRTLQVRAEVAIAEGVWSRASCALSAEELRLTVDNHNQTWAVPADGYVHQPSDNLLRIGIHPVVPEANFRGDLDEIRVHGRALTIEEVGLPIPDGLAVGPARQVGVCADDDRDEAGQCAPAPDCPDAGEDGEPRIATEEVCDGVDNDCDGFVDEDTAPAGWVCVPATGEAGFTMGSPVEEEGRDGAEDEHNVILSRPFLMQATEVTEAGYAEVVGGDAPCPTCPVDSVTWVEVAEYANQLSLDAGLPACYDIVNTRVTWARGQACPGVRMPTEAEWEWAARGATTTTTYLGDNVYGGCPEDTEVNRIAWNCTNSDDAKHAVAQLHPNAYGLFDMLGNLSEWVFDGRTVDPDLLPQTDPVAPFDDDLRMFRGAAFSDQLQRCRAAWRDTLGRHGSFPRLGFRLVRTAAHAADPVD